MPISLRFPCSLLAVLVLAVPFLAADDDEKPGKEATQHKVNPYHFFYESLVKKDDAGKMFTFGRNVLNMTDKALFVDWRKTNLKGYAPPKGRVVSEIPGPSEEFVLKDSELWYGAAPVKLDTKFKDIKKTEDTREKLQSTIQMCLPKEKAENSALYCIDVKFISTVTEEGGEFEYSYSWPDAKAALRMKDIPFQFQNKNVLVFFLNQDKALANKMKLGDVAQTMKFKSKEEPKYHVTTLDFYDQGKKMAVGSAPVALYLPKGLKVE